MLSKALRPGNATHRRARGRQGEGEPPRRRELRSHLSELLPRGDGAAPARRGARSHRSDFAPGALQKLRDVLAALEERHQRDLIPGSNIVCIRAPARASSRRTSGWTRPPSAPPSRRRAWRSSSRSSPTDSAMPSFATTRRHATRSGASGWRCATRIPPFGRATPSAPRSGRGIPTVPRRRLRLARRHSPRLDRARAAAPICGIEHGGPRRGRRGRAAGLRPGRAILGNAPGWRAARRRAAEPARAAGPLRMESEAWAPASVSLAWVGPGTAHRDFATLLTAAEILEARGAAAVSVDAHRHGGLFLVSSDAGANDRLPKTEEALRGAIEALRAGRVPNDELARGGAPPRPSSSTRWPTSARLPTIWRAPSSAPRRASWPIFPRKSPRSPPRTSSARRRNSSPTRPAPPS